MSPLDKFDESFNKKFPAAWKEPEIMIPDVTLKEKPKTKKCTKCGIEYDLQTGFYNDPKARDGKSCVCKQCHANYKKIKTQTKSQAMEMPKTEKEPEKSKICNKCQILKPFSGFINKDTKDGKASICKDCINESARKRKAEDLKLRKRNILEDRIAKDLAEIRSDLFAQIHAASEAEERTFNQQLFYIIKKYFQNDSR